MKYWDQTYDFEIGFIFILTHKIEKKKTSIDIAHRELFKTKPFRGKNRLLVDQNITINFSENTHLLWHQTLQEKNLNNEFFDFKFKFPSSSSTNEDVDIEFSIFESNSIPALL